MTSLDPRAPLVVDTTDLGRRPGTMRKSSRSVKAPDDLGTQVIAVKDGSPIDLTMRLESVMEGVLVSGVASATAVGECVRCLETLDRPVQVTFQELFVYPDKAAHHHQVAHDENDDDAEYELVGDLLDLEPVVRDAVVLALPFQPVCSEDCPGLCSQCGTRLADDPGHHHDDIDPRWASLQKLLPEE